MNLRIRKITVVILVLYGLLFLQLNVVQLVRADEYRSHPSNTRDIVRQFNEPRGSIVTADGVVIAQTIDTGLDERLRVYPHGPLYAHITGHLSLNYGAAGLENAYHDMLVGSDRDIELKSFSDLFVDRDRTADITLSIRHDVQRIARAALGERNGAVVAIDTQTGELLAMYSYPSYDPNLLSTADVDAAAESRFALISDEENPLRSRAYAERYPPGSTFKIITAAAAIETDLATPTDPVFPAVDGYTPPQTDRPISNFGGSTCGGDLTEMMRVSCNTGFAELAVNMGAGPLVATARAFGFNDDLDFDLGAVESTVPSVGFFDDNIPLLAQSAIGQFEVAASPLHMAVITAGVANDGVMMRPQLVASIVDSDGSEVFMVSPEVAATPIAFETSRDLVAILENVAANGTARSLRFDDVAVAGKTGTAEIGDVDATHAWMVGFAPAEQPRVAVAVFLQGDETTGQLTGGADAGPIAREVLRSALETLDVSN